MEAAGKLTDQSAAQKIYIEIAKGKNTPYDDAIEACEKITDKVIAEREIAYLKKKKENELIQMQNKCIHNYEVVDGYISGKEGGGANCTFRCNKCGHTARYIQSSWSDEVIIDERINNR